MASRRLRIKAVANLPVRRARGSEQASNEKLKGNVGVSQSSEPAKNEAMLLVSQNNKEECPDNSTEALEPISTIFSNLKSDENNRPTTNLTSRDLCINSVKSQEDGSTKESSENYMPQRSPTASEFTLQGSRISSESILQGSATASEDAFQVSQTASEAPFQSSQTTSEAPSRSSRTTSEAPPQSSRTTSEAPPQSSRTTSEAPPQSSRTTSEDAPHGSRTASDAAPQGSRTASEAPPQGSRTASEAPLQSTLTASEATSQGSHTVSETILHGNPAINELISQSETTSVNSNNVQGSEVSASGGINKTNQSQTSVRFGRKRVRPAVSLNAASRRPREIKESNKITAESENHNHSVTCNTSITEARNEVEKVSDVVDNTATSDSVESDVVVNSRSVTKCTQRVGVPGITRLIPTGTAIRAHQNEEEAGPLINNGVAREADVPSEKASGDDSILPVSVNGLHVLALPKHRAASAGSRCSASESEEDSKKCNSIASTITPPFIKKSKPKILNPNIVGVKWKSLNGSESEDDPKTPSSTATTVRLKPESVSEGDSDDGSVCSQSTNKTCDKSYGKRCQRRHREASWRMLEAKRQFLAKFGSQAPEKSQLTMLDLIFYNPTTNPMRSQPAKVNGLQEHTTGTTEVEVVEDRLAEESVDEPAVMNGADEEEDDESLAMPVPQVKVGADGQIILDEKSLVIETTGSKKSREDLANSVAVMDLGTGSYNKYSKMKPRRGKDWPERETIRFYRALQTVGTDFLLMQKIFPKRSRTELKTKFKKEERINRSLIEKALSHPLPFDDIQKEMALAEDAENKVIEDEKQSEIKSKKNTEKITDKKTKRKSRGVARRGVLSRTLDKEDSGVTRNKRKKKELKNRSDVKSNKAKRPGKLSAKAGIKRKIVDVSLSSEEEEEGYSVIQNGVSSFHGNDSESKSCDGEISDKDKEGRNNSDSETDEMKFLSRSSQATRSGRVSKPRILTDITQDEHNTNWVKYERAQCSSDAAASAILCRSNINPPFEGMENSFKNIEPGSLIVLTTESPDNPGHQILNVFMVSRGSNPQSSINPEAISLAPESLQIISSTVDQPVLHSEDTSLVEDVANPS